MIDIKNINSYVQIKTSNNEDVIAYMTQEDQYNLYVDDPLIIEEQYINGNVVLNFNRYDAFSEKHNLILNKSQIIFWNKASDSIIDYYLKFKEYLEKIGDVKFNLSLENSAYSLNEFLNSKINVDKKTSKIKVIHPTSNTAH